MIYVIAAELENLQLNVRSMLDDEIAWLGNFVPSESADLSDVDNSLLAGHLRFIRTLFACSAIDKSLFGMTEALIVLLYLGTLLDVSLPLGKSPSFHLL